jgi:hypothetical protein
MKKHTLLPCLTALAMSSFLVACGGGSDDTTNNQNDASHIAPVISLLGDNPLTLQIGHSYEEFGATATDNIDGEVDVTIAGVVDSSNLGEYEVTYQASDSDGNTSQVTRSVAVTPTHVQIIETLEQSGMLPILNRDASLTGLDENNNVIRDDIDTYIFQHYHNDSQIKAISQFAKATQSMLTTNLNDRSAVKAASIKGGNAINCLYLKFDISDGDKSPAIIIREIESITTNTKQRLMAYLAFNKALDGTTLSIPEGDTCE